MTMDSDFPLTGRGSAKWNGAADAGFTIVPDALIHKQAKLGLSATELVVLLQIISFWWAADRPPFPSTTTIASRMGVEVRTVQRAIRALLKSGLIDRDLRPGRDGKAVRVLTLDSLVMRLNQQVAADPVLSTKARTRNQKTVTVVVQPQGATEESRA